MRYAVMIPCFNEEQTIGKVIDDICALDLPIDVYVADNNSTDNSSKIIQQCCQLYPNVYSPFVAERGKGRAIRACWNYVQDYDMVFMIDADDTTDVNWFTVAAQYTSNNDQCDMLVGDRLQSGYDKYGRLPNRIFNHMIVPITRLFIGQRIDDPLSGTRAFSKRFVNTFTPIADGFDLETELNMACRRNRFTVGNLPCRYRDRPVGSFSKLHALRDGMKILLAFFKYRRTYND